VVFKALRSRRPDRRDLRALTPPPRRVQMCACVTAAMTAWRSGVLQLDDGEHEVHPGNALVSR